MESSYFNFNNVSSEEMGVKLISLDLGLFSKPFLSNRSIVEKKIPGRDKPYFQRLDLEPLSFKLTLFIEEWQDRDNLRQIQRWLFQDYYKPLQFYNDLDKIYYAILESDTTLVHNGSENGYIEVNVRCDSPFSYGFPVEVVAEDSLINVFNEGDIPVRPHFEIIKTSSAGDVSITNLKDGSTVSISNLKLSETILISSQNESIISSLQELGVYRYDDHNDVWLSLWIGDNQLQIDGDCIVKMAFQPKYLN